MSSEGSKRKKKKIVSFDYTLMFIVLFLLLFGLVMLYSVSTYEANLKFGSAGYYLKKQLLATGIGIVAMFTIMLIDRHIFEVFALPLYLASLVGILLVLTPLGYEAGGARRWLNLRIFSLQPAELTKLSLIIFFAFIVCRMGDRIRTIKGFAFLMALAMPHVLLIYGVTSNLSSAIIVLGIVFVMLFVSTPDYKPFIITALIGIAVAVTAVELVKHDILPADISFRLGRIKAWLNPEDYAADKGYQTLQALYAIGSGDFFGKGLGASIQKLGFIPEAQNDMIFSIICEELGLVGGVAIMAMFMILIWRFVVVANNANDKFGALLVVGVLAHISIQVVLNIAVVTNTIPNTGITLPFISYGGTSVVFLLSEIGIVLNVSKSVEVEE